MLVRRLDPFSLPRHTRALHLGLSFGAAVLASLLLSSCKAALGIHTPVTIILTNTTPMVITNETTVTVTNIAAPPLLLSNGPLIAVSNHFIVNLPTYPEAVLTNHPCDSSLNKKPVRTPDQDSCACKLWLAVIRYALPPFIQYILPGLVSALGGLLGLKMTATEHAGNMTLRQKIVSWAGRLLVVLSVATLALLMIGLIQIYFFQALRGEQRWPVYPESAMPHLENTVTNIVNVTNITNCVGCTNTSPTTTTQGSLLTNIVSAVVSFTNFPQIIITNVTLPTVPQKGIDGPPPPPHYTMISPSTLWITVLMTAAVAAWRIRTIMRRISYSKSERHAPGHSWKEAIDLIDSFTTIISTQFRTVALALLSMSVLGFVRTGLQFAGADVLGQRDSRLYLAAIGFFALLALVCDYLQYLSGLLTTLIINMREDLRDSVYLAFVVSPRFRWLRFFFWAKQVTLILAAVLFLELAASFIWYVVRHG